MTLLEVKHQSGVSRYLAISLLTECWHCLWNATEANASSLLPNSFIQ